MGAFVNYVNYLCKSCNSALALPVSAVKARLIFNCLAIFTCSPFSPYSLIFSLFAQIKK
jgi:hypothetical protein